MNFTDDSVFSENLQPSVLRVPPFRPEWFTGDCGLPVSWDEQVQARWTPYNAGATMLHVHVRDPRQRRAVQLVPEPNGVAQHGAASYAESC